MMPGKGTNELLRLCVRAVSDKEGKDRKGVSKAFAVCTASLQDKGYMTGGKLTPKGRSRLRAKRKEPDFKRKQDGYEATLAAARGEDLDPFLWMAAIAEGLDDL
jgi:hypothetical protein